MKPYSVKEGQTVLDVALQLYGSIEYVVKLCVDNGIDLNTDLTGNQVLSYDADLFTLSPISNQLQLNNVFLATAGELIVNEQPAIGELLEHTVEEHTENEHN